MAADSIPAWLPEQLHPGWEFLAAYPLALAAVIALAGISVAIVVRLILLYFVGRLVRPLPGELAEQMLQVIANVGAFVIGYLALVAAIQVLGLPERVESVVTRILVSLLILRLMRSGMRAAHIGLKVLAALRDRYQIVEERTMPLFDLLANVLVIGAAAYALLMVWNIDPTAWLASAGVLGIAVGFAARETLANLFAGFFIIADTPYKVGDYIVFDTGERGEVTKVGMRSTRILTRDDVEVIMPNSAMANAKVVNESGGRWERFRIRIKVGVAYGSDVDDVVELLEQIAAEHDTVCKDPNPRVRMRGFGDSSLDFELLCWVDQPAQRGLVTHELYIKIYKELDRAGIEIPFPQRDVWMRGSEGQAGKEDSGE
ncbi:MAG: mechanosensitive ion channel family protein [Candidatus Wenzhouxiangella sp. M2_3B_020]